MERFLTLQRRKSEQSSALCLRYIRARNAVAELEATVKKLETLGPGLYVWQYEQLNIDHQNYNTKIEGNYSIYIYDYCHFSLKHTYYIIISSHQKRNETIIIVYSKSFVRNLKFT